MIYHLGACVLRPLELSDLDLLYAQKNDPEIAQRLGGFSTGYSRPSLADWFEAHRKRSDEVLWAIVDTETNKTLGHVGLYQIDYRVRQAEFGILIGERGAWGKGLGSKVTDFVVRYGFKELNLRRIYLSVLATNSNAIALYNRCGFKKEGCLREAQYKGGKYVDVLLMARGRRSGGLD